MSEKPESNARPPDNNAGSPQTGAPARPAPRLLFSAFLEQAKASPRRTAAAWDGGTCSYGELEAKSRAVASALTANGVGPGDRVAILADRSPALLWSVLGVARTGAIFVVLDRSYPQARLSTLVSICGPKLLISALPENDPCATDLARAFDLDVLNTRTSACAGADAFADREDILASNPAYLLFTSGSTGIPKCVACSHEPLINFIEWQAREFSLTRSDRFTMLSGLSHDPILRDIFAPLNLGAVLLIPDQRQILEPGGLKRWFARAAPTVTHLTPPMGRLLTSSNDTETLPALRLAFWGGDVLRPSLVSAVQAVAPHAAHVNFYGATETPQAAAAFRFDGDMLSDRVPIGRGVPGFEISVTDDDGKAAAPGALGEIVVRSRFLSLGYLVDGVIPMAGSSGAASEYRTGDLGFARPDGIVVVVGRRDDQVKIRGYRVELGDVTSGLLQHPEVDAGVTLAVGADADLYLHSFVSPARADGVTEEALRRFAGEKLPSYMIPQVVTLLPALPLLPNGKVDRKALQALAEGKAQDARSAPAAAPAGSIESQLISAWSGFLRKSDITPESSFSSLGGDSLSYVQIYLATEELLGEMPQPWTSLSISQLAATKAPGKSRALANIDSAMLVRAAAICLIVAGHFQLLNYGGGATSALFLVSGFIFGGLQLNESVAHRSAKPVLGLLRSLLIPAGVFTAAMFTVKLFLGKDPDLSFLLMYGDFIDYSQVIPTAHSKWDGHEFYLWYLHSIFHILLILYIVLSATISSSFVQRSPERAIFILFLLAVAARFGLPILADPDFLRSGAEPLDVVNYLPSTHLATFVLGALLAMLLRDGKPWLLLLLLIYAAVSAKLYGPGEATALAVAGLLLIFMPRLPMPRFAARVVYLIAGASLFIYMTHFAFASAARLAGIEALGLHFAIAIVGGVASWLAWNRALPVASSWLGDLRRKRANALG